MVEAMSPRLRRLTWVLSLLLIPSVACAHRLDEYLQATLVAIEPAGFRLHINLTPGVAVAEQVVALIDRDRDDEISTNEALAYAELLKHDLQVRLDERNLDLQLTASYFPDPTELRAGMGIIQMEFAVISSGLAAGRHKLTVENRHLPAASVYLFNAARPGSASFQITGQKRNENQSTGEIAFNFHPPPSSSLPVVIVVSFAALAAVLFAGLAAKGAIVRAARGYQIQPLVPGSVPLPSQGNRNGRPSPPT